MQNTTQVTYEQAVQNLKDTFCMVHALEDLAEVITATIDAVTGYDLELSITEVVLLEHNSNLKFKLTYKPSSDLQVTSNPYYQSVVQYLLRDVFTLGNGYAVVDDGALLMQYATCTVPSITFPKIQRQVQEYKAHASAVETITADARLELVDLYKGALYDKILLKKRLEEILKGIDGSIRSAVLQTNKHCCTILQEGLAIAPWTSFSTRNIEPKYNAVEVLDFTYEPKVENGNASNSTKG